MERLIENKMLNDNVLTIYWYKVITFYNPFSLEEKGWDEFSDDEKILEYFRY